MDAINKICMINNQPRLLPRRETVKWSNNGAQINYKEEGNPTSANNPIVDLDIPSSVSHACSKVIVRSNGTPETKPIDNVISIFFSKYGFIEVKSFFMIQNS